MRSPLREACRLPVAGLVHRDHLGFVSRPRVERVELREIAAHDERRARDRPQAHHRALLVLRESRVRPALVAGHWRIAPSGSMSASGKWPGPRKRRPVAQALGTARRAPSSHPRNRRCMRHMFACVETLCALSASGVAPGEVLKTISRPVLSMPCESPRSRACDMPAEVVALDEVDAPRRNERLYRVVVFLRAGLSTYRRHTCRDSRSTCRSCSQCPPRGRRCL